MGYLALHGSELRGLVRVAPVGLRGAHLWSSPVRPLGEVWAGLRSPDLRQAQLAALRLPRVGMTTAADTGDWGVKCEAEGCEANAPWSQARIFM